LQQKLKGIECRIRPCYNNIMVLRFNFSEILFQKHKVINRLVQIEYVVVFQTNIAYCKFVQKNNIE